MYAHIQNDWEKHLGAIKPKGLSQNRLRSLMPDGGES